MMTDTETVTVPRDLLLEVLENAEIHCLDSEHARAWLPEEHIEYDHARELIAALRRFVQPPES